MTSVANNLVAALNFTRSEAITRGAGIYICARESQTTSCGDNWLNGWLVYAPWLDDDGSRKPSNDNLLRVHGPVTMPNLVGEANLSRVKFGGSGFSTGSAGTITLCSSDSEDSTSVVISTSGRVRIESEYYKDGETCNNNKNKS